MHLCLCLARSLALASSRSFRAILLLWIVSLLGVFGASTVQAEPFATSLGSGAHRLYRGWEVVELEPPFELEALPSGPSAAFQVQPAPFAQLTPSDRDQGSARSPRTASTPLSVNKNRVDLTVEVRALDCPCELDTARYRVVVRNQGDAASSGTITVRDTLPFTFVYLRGQGSGWTVLQAGRIVTGTTTRVIAPGDSAVFTFEAIPNFGSAPQSIQGAIVSGGGDYYNSNNKWRLVQAICTPRKPDLTIDKRHTQDFQVGQNGEWVFVIRNLGTIATNEPFTVRDTLPVGTTFVSAAAAPWQFSTSGNIVTATYPNALAGGDSVRFSVTVAVDARAVPGVLNRATVFGGGDDTPGNNRDTDRTPVNPSAQRPDLIVDLRPLNEPCELDTARYRVVVRNIGEAPTAGTITVRDTMPFTYVYVRGSGPGWTVLQAGRIVTATHPGPLAAGDSLAFTFDAIANIGSAPQITQTAVVSGGGDARTTNNTDTETQKICEPRKPDLTLDKRHTENFAVGQNGIWTVVVTNLGTIATDEPFTVRDTLPVGTTFVSAAAAPWQFSTSGNVVTATYPNALAGGDSVKFTLTVAVDAQAIPSVLNAATVSGGGDDTPGNNRDTDRVPVSPAPPDLTVDLVPTNTPCEGDTARYRVVVRNLGGSPTTGTITVRDTLPATFTFLNAAGSGWTIQNVGGVLVATHPGPLAPGDSLVFTFEARVGPGSAPQVTQTATVSGGGDVSPGNNRDTATQPICAARKPDLTIDKRHTENFTVGQNGAWTVVVTNVGTAASSGTITVRDTLPAGTTFVSGAAAPWQFSSSGNVVTATYPNAIAVGDSAKFTLTVAVNDAALPSVLNAATVSGGGDDTPGNNRDTDRVPVSPAPTRPDLTLDKRHTENFTVGQNGAWTVVVTNVGTAASSGTITVRDTLPAGTTFVSGAAAPWQFSTSGNVVTATYPNAIAVGDSAKFTLTVAVDAQAIPSVLNAATVSGGGDDTPGNNRDTDRVPVSPAPPDLTVDLVPTNAPCEGDTARYRVVVRNLGGSPTTGTITVRDTLPATFTFLNAAGSGWTIQNVGGVLVATHPGPLAPGDSLVFTFEARVGPGSAPQVTQTATVSGGGDVSPGNNRDTATQPICVARKPDLTIDKRHTENFTVGQNGAWTVVVTNVGTAASSGTITVRDTLPVGTTFVSGAIDPWQFTVSGNVVTATYPASLAAGDSVEFRLIVAVDDAALPSVLNAATVSGGGDDTPGNNRDTDRVPVSPRLPRPDLTLDKRHTEDFVIGQNGTWTFVVTNVGTAASNGTITVRDTLPRGTRFISGAAAPWQFSTLAGVVTATYPNAIPVGDSAKFTLTVSVDPGSFPSVLNPATVSGGGDDTPGNNRDTDRVPVALAPVTDLTIDKSHKAAFVVGQTGQYAIRVSNVGTLASSGTITVRDTLPNGLGYVNAVGAGWTFQVTGAIVVATTNQIIAPSGSSTFNLVVSVSAAAVPGVVNAATVSGGGDTNPGNNRDTDPTPVSFSPPDISVDKRHTTALAVGDDVTYTIVVTNVGGSSTTGAITVRDTLPGGLAFVGASGAGWIMAYQAPVLTATRNALLAAGDSSKFTLTARVLPAAVPSVTNAATASTPGDTNPRNDRDTDPGSVAGPGQLTVEKRATPFEVEIGDVVDYTVLVRNVGTGGLRNVVVDDQLPPGLRYLAGSAVLDGARIADPAGAPGPRLQFAIGTVSAAQLRTLRYRVSVGAGVGLGDGVNVAVASSPRDSTFTPGDTSNVARAVVRVRPGAFRDEGIIAGKVFMDGDCDSNRVQGPEEIGIPGVRLVLEDGSSAVTDAEGKYSFQHVRPRMHVLRVDGSTLPPGVVLRSLSNRHAFDPLSRFIDLKRGEFHRADFADGHCSPEVIAEVKARRVVGELSGPLVEGVASRDSDMPGDGHGGLLELVRSPLPVPADGVSELRFRVRRAPSAPVGPVTVETTVGTIMAADEDPDAPGTQISLAGDESLVSLRAPQSPMPGMLRVTSGDQQDSASVRFITSPRSLLLVGLLDGRVDWRRLKTSALCGPVRDDFEDALRDAAFDSQDGRVRRAGRGALFASGAVPGDVMLTLRYDTEHDPFARRFRDMRPLEGYDVLGDASTHEYDARSTSRLFVRAEKGASFAQFGDFVTPSPAGSQLGLVTRSLNGGLARVGNRWLELTGYGTQARERQVVDELPGQGVSGPYRLSRPDGVLGTEIVEVVTRDRNHPARILRREPQVRFADYTLEAFTGRLLFRRPIPSVDFDLNPVSIRVTYEIETGGDGYGVYGGGLTLTPSPRLSFGVSASRDEDPATPTGLASAHALVHPFAGLSIAAEVAHSDSGGALFDGASKAEAWRGDARYDGTSFTAGAFALRTDRGFTNTSSGLGAGRRELGANARVLLGKTSLFGRALRTEDLVTDGRRDGIEAGVGQRFGRFTAEGAYRWAEETSRPASLLTTGATPNQTSSLRGRLAADLPGTRRGTVFGELEQDLDRSDQQRWALGGDMQLAPRTRVYMRHENLSSFAGPFALNTAQERATTLFGIASDELRDGHVFTEYRARDAFAGRDAQAAFGLRNRWSLSPGVRLDGSLERVETIRGGSGTSTAVTGGFEYTGNPLWKGTSRLEFRTASSVESWLATAGLARKLSRDWTGLARTTWFLTPDEERTDARSQVGLAWRQTERNQWDALARYEHRLERLQSGTDPFRRTSHVVTSDVNWHPARAWTLSGQGAAKWGTSETATRRDVTDAQLLGGRALVDLTSRLDLGLLGRALWSDHFDAHRTGLGAELGVLVAKDLRLAGGYNVFGFRDPAIAGADCTDEGPYVRLGFKFGERLFGGDARQPRAGTPVAVREAAAAQRAATTALAGAMLPLEVTPLRERVTDQGIARDLAAIDAWQAKLASLPGLKSDPFRATAARQWLDVARTEYTDNDETGFAESAFRTGTSLVDAIANRATPAGPGAVPQVPAVTGSPRVREDLWKRLEKMKQDPGFSCAAEELARMEVELMWAGNEQIDMDDCHSAPHANEAEKWANLAEPKLKNCGVPVPTPKVEPWKPLPDSLPPANLRAPRNVHFAFDRCELSPESRKLVEEMASLLKRYPKLKVRVEGYTDSRGTSDYNIGLSACRVCAVRAALEEFGISTDRMTGAAKGKSQLLTPERSRLGHAKNRRVEMVLLDEHDVELQGERQEKDLQLEGPYRPGQARKKASKVFPENRATQCR